ncbi:ThrE_2 domain-containing protein [Candidatus Hydrogenisulfobacillus filiaventi]|uniref:ThrE_2 domain-containing protein n=1 Tax=Candidatus Hydrogenisulfobacillus filiaventi TaxID=2707344 RepID=A0A6F8ZF74_9FIRM|nr:threonine/serine exporter family protein [Bacillota bacterium]CAB1128112.1 ThrE_2 domain-containing protein [Candidatus Hydrogenisulfobacillus filiaventi]
MSGFWQGPLPGFASALLTVAAFAVVYQLPPSRIGVAALIGGVAWGAAGILGYGPADGLGGDFAGAFLVGVLAEAAAVLTRTPALSYAVPAIIPFVPGYLAYRSMVAFLTGRFLNGLRLGLEAFLAAGALAAGLAVAATLARALRRRRAV